MFFFNLRVFEWCVAICRAQQAERNRNAGPLKPCNLLQSWVLESDISHPYFCFCFPNFWKKTSHIFPEILLGCFVGMMPILQPGKLSQMNNVICGLGAGICEAVCAVTPVERPGGMGMGYQSFHGDLVISLGFNGDFMVIS